MKTIARAAQWVITIESEQLTLKEWDAFEAWLDESPGNLLAYEAAHRARHPEWALTISDCPKAENPPQPGTAAPARVASTNLARSTWRRPAFVFGGVGLCLALGSLTVSMIGPLISRSSLTPQQLYRTPIGAVQTVTLADGSHLQLNTGTEVRARLGPDARNLALVHGEALFKVASDPRRPFAVTAGGETLWALGTQFSVRLRDTGSVDVIVSDGRVGLDCRPVRQSPTPMVRASCATELTAGVHAIIQSGQWKTEKLSTAELHRRFGWTLGYLEFNGQSLPEVIQELNRYIPIQIEIADRRLADLRLSGRVKLGPPDQVLAVILNIAHARTDPSAQDPKVIRLISASP